MSIAILGTRGVPPRYGGFETFAAELGRRLVARGHEVTVYCRARLYPGEPTMWEGLRRVDLPAVSTKYLETVSHALLSAIHAAGRPFDAAILCNAANAFVLPILRAARIPVAINVDGIERKRKKWNALGRLVYLGGEAMSVQFADAVVADARVIADYYRRAHGIGTEVIAYGAGFPPEGDSDVLARLGLASRRYVLYVSRFEPENHPLEVVREYAGVAGDVPLVMVGDAPYATELVSAVRAAAARDPRVVMPGALYGTDYRTLQRNALVYVQATEVGGTHPALIEAMGSGGAVLANDTPENREVGLDVVQFFRFGDGSLPGLIESAVCGHEELEPWRARARARAREYDWDAVADAYARLLGRLAG